MQSLERLDGRRPKTYANKSTEQDQTAQWLPKGLVDVPRFELPLNVTTLESMTPLEYVTKYVIVQSKVKRMLYHKPYIKHREAKVDGIDSIDKLKKALKEVCHISSSAQTHQGPPDIIFSYYVHSILDLDIDEAIRINFKSFTGLAALAERIFNPNYMPTWIEHEPALTADYLMYKKLVEKRKKFQEFSERKEAERNLIKQQKNQAKLQKPVKNHLMVEFDTETTQRCSSDTVLTASASEEQLLDQVENCKAQLIELNNKTSITKILEISTTPAKCFREKLEQIDFHAIKWKLRGVKLSKSMERLMQIITSL